MRKYFFLIIKGRWDLKACYHSSKLFTCRKKRPMQCLNCDTDFTVIDSHKFYFSLTGLVHKTTENTNNVFSSRPSRPVPRPPPRIHDRNILPLCDIFWMFLEISSSSASPLLSPSASGRIINLSRHMRKGALALCGLRSFKRTCVTTQKGPEMCLFVWSFL